MKTSTKAFLTLTSIVVLSLILFTGVALAHGPNGDENPPEGGWLAQMQQWMDQTHGPGSWTQMLQFMTQAHGPEATAEMLQWMNESGGCHGGQNAEDMMSGNFMGGMGYGGMMGGSYQNMMGDAYNGSFMDSMNGVN
ncbi:MAG: hypothetical protein GXP42_07205 [Chloroflexi bacterium]|nr:hypothetical protein [Chloroflexota bacterium]